MIVKQLGSLLAVSSAAMQVAATVMLLVMDLETVVGILRRFAQMMVKACTHMNLSF